jgi:hypothetical protein
MTTGKGRPIAFAPLHSNSLRVPRAEAGFEKKSLPAKIPGLHEEINN